MKIVIEIPAEGSSCGTCPFSAMDWNRGYPLGSRVCTNPAFEQDGACPDIAHGQRHQRCLDAEIKESDS